MSLSNSYNTPEINAYDSFVKFVDLLADMAKNPPSLQGANAEALKTINEAKQATAKLVSDRDAFKVERQDVLDKLNAKSTANEARALEVKNAQKDLDTRAQAVNAKVSQYETLKIDLEDRQEKIKVKESMLSKLESSLATKEQALMGLEAKLLGIEKMLNDKNDSLTNRETALRQILG